MTPLRPIFILLLLQHISSAKSKDVYYDFTISYFDGAPDGVPVRILGVNNLFPGPTIRASKNDFLSIKVTNLIQTKESTTIHWHGLEQFLNPFVDGPRMITQCDIPFNSSFVYRFQVIQSGTYWYHSHHSTQASEGLWGAMIIDNTPEVYNYDGEFIVTAIPWYHIPGKLQAEWYADMEKSKGTLPAPDSTLVNGVGYYPCEYAVKQNMSCNPAFEERYILFEVERGKTYRFRYLNPSPVGGCLMSIDGHKMTLIETDGVDTVPSEPYDALSVSTGGRSSVLVTMDGELDQYWIRFQGLFDSIKPSDVPNINPYPEAYFGAHATLAVLRYKDPVAGKKVQTQPKETAVRNTLAVQGRPEKHDLDQGANNANAKWEDRHTPREELRKNNDPIRVSFATPPFPVSVGTHNPTQIPYNAAGPIGDESAPDYVNQTIVINIPDVDDPASIYHRAGFNNITFSTSGLDKPALYKALLGETLPMSLYPIEIKGFGSDYVVEVIFSDFGNTGHPIHLHGHTFWVMGRGARHDGPFVEEMHRPTFQPVTRRETVSCFTHSWLVIRFRADNPGVWLMHCHISHHFDIAMGLVFVEGMDEAKKIYKFPADGVELCKLNGIGLEQPAASDTSSISTETLIFLIISSFLAVFSVHG